MSVTTEHQLGEMSAKISICLEMLTTMTTTLAAVSESSTRNGYEIEGLKREMNTLKADVTKFKLIAEDHTLIKQRAIGIIWFMRLFSVAAVVSIITALVRYWGYLFPARM